MANYLVTGGAGFIGSNIAEYLLEQGESVRIFDNFSTGYRHNIDFMADRLDIVSGSLCRPEDCAHAAKDMDYVLHQAAIPSVPRSVDEPLESHENNVTGTVNMLIAARDAGIKRFVYAASSSAYGDQEAEFMKESFPTGPLSPYGVAKLAGELYVKAFCECYGMEGACLRYFNVFGPRQDPGSHYSGVISLFITCVLEGRQPTIYGDGGQARDFTYVENNVKANILAATGDYDAKGQVYNVACGTSVSVLELLECVKRNLGSDIEPLFAPARIGDIRNSKADISRARADLKFEVTVPFEEGLSRTIEWYKQSLK